MRLQLWKQCLRYSASDCNSSAEHECAPDAWSLLCYDWHAYSSMSLASSRGDLFRVQDITGSRTTPLSSLPVSLDEEYEMVE